MAKHHARRRLSSADKARKANPGCIRFSNAHPDGPLAIRNNENISRATSARITGIPLRIIRPEVYQVPPAPKKPELKVAPTTTASKPTTATKPNRPNPKRRAQAKKSA